MQWISLYIRLLRKASINTTDNISFWRAVGSRPSLAAPKNKVLCFNISTHNVLVGVLGDRCYQEKIKANFMSFLPRDGVFSCPLMTLQNLKLHLQHAINQANTEIIDKYKKMIEDKANKKAIGNITFNEVEGYVREGKFGTIYVATAANNQATALNDSNFLCFCERQ